MIIYWKKKQQQNLSYATDPEIYDHLTFYPKITQMNQLNNPLCEQKYILY